MGYHHCVVYGFSVHCLPTIDYRLWCVIMIDAATTLTSWHLMVTFCTLYVAQRMHFFEPKAIDGHTVVLFGLLNGTSIGLLNLSLGFNSIGFYQVGAHVILFLSLRDDIQQMLKFEYMFCRWQSWQSYLSQYCWRRSSCRKDSGNKNHMEYCIICSPYVCVKFDSKLKLMCIHFFLCWHQLNYRCAVKVSSFLC